MATLACELAEYARRLSFEELGEDVVREVKRRVLDSIGCALGAHDSEPAAIARRVALAAPAADGARVWTTRARAVPERAAFANGVLVRYLDCNDTYLSLEPAHPSDNIPACFAAAEAAGADGRQLVTAIVLAYEVQCRLCDAASIRARRWDHVTYGAFSTALAAGKLMGLTTAQLEQAVNLAGVNAAALRQTRVGHLSMWKGCAFANAARGGLFAAALAAAGMTGPEPIFEGEMGFWNQVSGRFELDVAGFGGGGRPFMIRNTSIKYWPAEYHAQSAIAAALALRRQIGDLAAVERVEIHTFRAAVEIIGGEREKWEPTSRETADHSLPYCVAAALHDGEITLAQFTDERIRHPGIRALMERMSLHEDERLTGAYPQGIPNRLVVHTRDGRTLSEEVVYPRGHARNPLTDAEVEAKFAAWASRCLPPAQQERVRERVWRLDELADVSAVTEALALPEG